MSKHIRSKLVEKQMLTSDIYKYIVHCHEMAKDAAPGQFLEIKCSDEIDALLRRPISISNVNKTKGEIEFIFQVKGKGTQALLKKEIDDEIDILGPLGEGVFTISSDYKKAAIIGGGIGIFPLLYLANQLNAEVYTYLGFRTKDAVLLENEFKRVSKELKITTDDGTYGSGGLVTYEFEKDLSENKFDMIFACGPRPMLKAVKKIAIENNIPCEISVEERMGCGVGACLGCACKITKGDEWRFGHVCKDGPVFKAEEIELD